MNNEIETVAEGPGWHQFRRKIHGGWIYESTIECHDNSSLCCCFIPDPDHEWKLALMEESND